MNTKFAVIGGDLRTIKLAKMLAEDGNEVYTYGLEKAEELKEEKAILALCTEQRIHQLELLILQWLVHLKRKVSFMNI